MICIYSDSSVIDNEWLPLIKFDQSTQICHSFVEYQNTTADYKIAFTAERVHNDHDLNSSAYGSFEDKVAKLSAISDRVFVLDCELHHYHWAMWHYCHRNNVHWCMPGFVNDNDAMNDCIIYWGDWFKTTANVYKQLPNVLSTLQPHTVKHKSFDALLGSPKPHRTFVANSVNKYQLQDQFVLTYGGTWNNKEFYAKDYFIYEPGTEIIESAPGTMGAVKYHGILCHLSQVIATEVYNQTAYSIVAETDHDNTLSFFSEKTAKPIIARRLFVAFTGYKFLHNLRKLGFRTFGNVIDESYDLIVDNNDRYAAAFEQVRWLCQQDQQSVLEAIKSTVDHNYDLMMNTNWTMYAAQTVQQHINEIFLMQSPQSLPIAEM